MSVVGIRAANAYVGRACLSVRDLFSHRGLNPARFDNLMMDEKSVNLPCEDAVTNAVNAARPLVEALDPADRDRIELLVVGTESGLDLGKPLSTYVHHHLGLSARCRSFEVKHACYGGTAALRTAVGIVGDSPTPGALGLVVATDAPSAAALGTYWEPSEGAGAVALLIGSEPRLLALDPGACGFHTYEVMDTARPGVDVEIVDSDLSLLAYLTCLQESYAHYRQRVQGVALRTTFDHLVFHTPFAGMVKGAHRTLMRRVERLTGEEAEADFERRVAPSLAYPRRVGNLFGASLYLALISLLETTPGTSARRVGLFSYGSGCASEFYSGVVPVGASAAVPGKGVGAALDDRRRLGMGDYDALAAAGGGREFGTREALFPVAGYGGLYRSHFEGQGLLVLDRIENYHREYRWT